MRSQVISDLWLETYDWQKTNVTFFARPPTLFWFFVFHLFVRVLNSYCNACIISTKYPLTQETNDVLHKISCLKIILVLCVTSHMLHITNFFFSLFSSRIPSPSRLLTINLSYTFLPGLVFMIQHKCVSMWRQTCLTTFSIFRAPFEKKKSKT